MGQTYINVMKNALILKSLIKKTEKIEVIIPNFKGIILVLNAPLPIFL